MLIPKIKDSYKSSLLMSTLGLLKTVRENNYIMFEFGQYLGFLAFLGILTLEFWLMIFLTAMIPYWITGSLLKKEAKLKKQEVNNSL